MAKKTPDGPTIQDEFRTKTATFVKDYVVDNPDLSINRMELDALVFMAVYDWSRQVKVLRRSLMTAELRKLMPKGEPRTYAETLLCVLSKHREFALQPRRVFRDGRVRRGW